MILTDANRSLLGMPFFYYDEETGLGWDSRIETIYETEGYAGFIFVLECGSRVKRSWKDVKDTKTLFHNVPNFAEETNEKN